jgi:hypothetical protein
VFSTACDSASSVWETEKSGVGGDSLVVFDQKFPGEKKNVTRRVVVMQQPVLLSPKFGQKSSYTVTQLPSNVTTVCGIDCLACQACQNNLLDIKENEEHALGFTLHLSRLFRPR